MLNMRMAPKKSIVPKNMNETTKVMVKVTQRLRTRKASMMTDTNYEIHRNSSKSTLLRI